MPLKVKQLRWAPLEARLREIISNLIAATRQQAATQTFIDFLSTQIQQFGHKEESQYVLTPLEQKLTVVKGPTSQVNNVIVISFLIIKVLVHKLLFKPYRVAEYMLQSTLMLHDQFVDNCVVMGYTLIAIASDVLYETSRDLLRQVYQMDSPKFMR